MNQSKSTHQPVFRFGSTLLVGFVLFLAVFFITALSATTSLDKQQRNYSEAMQARIQLLSGTLKEALINDDRAAMRSILSGAAELQQVDYVAIQDANGVPIVYFGGAVVTLSESNGARNYSDLSFSERMTVRTIENRLNLTQNGERIGSINVISDISHFQIKVFQAHKQVAVMAFLILLAGFILTQFLRTYIRKNADN